jgi:hypothetical protein
MGFPYSSVLGGQYCWHKVVNCNFSRFSSLHVYIRHGILRTGLSAYRVSDDAAVSHLDPFSFIAVYWFRNEHEKLPRQRGEKKRLLLLLLLSNIVVVNQYQ